MAPQTQSRTQWTKAARCPCVHRRQHQSAAAQRRSLGSSRGPFARGVNLTPREALPSHRNEASVKRGAPQSRRLVARAARNRSPRARVDRHPCRDDVLDDGAGMLLGIEAVAQNLGERAVVVRNPQWLRARMPRPKEPGRESVLTGYVSRPGFAESRASTPGRGGALCSRHNAPDLRDSLHGKRQRRRTKTEVAGRREPNCDIRCPRQIWTLRRYGAPSTSGTRTPPR